MRRLRPTLRRPLRLAAATVVAAGLMVGGAGCTLISNQATEIKYAPSDGINVAGGGPIQVRNALIVANEDGTLANLIAAFVNPTTSQQTLNLSVGESGDRITVFVPAGKTVSLGVGDVKPLALGDIATPPGATLSMYFQSGDGQGVSAAVPVLGPDLAYLKPYAPTSPAPYIEPTPSPTPTVTPTPTAEETPAPTQG